MLFLFSTLSTYIMAIFEGHLNWCGWFKRWIFSLLIKDYKSIFQTLGQIVPQKTITSNKDERNENAKREKVRANLSLSLKRNNRSIVKSKKPVKVVNRNTSDEGILENHMSYPQIIPFYPYQIVEEISGIRLVI